MLIGSSMNTNAIATSCFKDSTSLTNFSEMKNVSNGRKAIIVRQNTIANVAQVSAAVRAALFQTAALSVARLGTLVEPAFTGLNAFLADTPASSGIMILEYVAHSAVADIRRLAAPAALGGAVLSRGVEEHAGFGTQSARATSDTVAAYRAVLGCELTAAVRALRMQDRVPAAGGPLRWAYDLAGAVLEPGTADRPLDSDLVAVQRVLDGFAMMDTAPETDTPTESR